MRSIGCTKTVAPQPEAAANANCHGSPIETGFFSDIFLLKLNFRLYFMFDWQRSFEEGSFEDESEFEQNNLATIDPLKSQAN